LFVITEQFGAFCPGPPSIPILGAIYLIFNSEGPKALIDKSLLKYGDIARIEFGMLRLYVVNGFEMAKELFNKDCTSHRPTTWYQREIKGFHGQVLGIIEASGQPWVEQRRFGLKNLKDLVLVGNLWI
jgi:Cytochrome P450.